MLAEVDFETLLRQAGAEPPRRGKRWGCPYCRKAGRVNVDLERGLYCCFTGGCAFRGNMWTLGRAAGENLDSPEWRRRAAAERELRLLQERVNGWRNCRWKEVAANYRKKAGEYLEMRRKVMESGAPDAVDAGLVIYADLLALAGELLLLQVLPEPELSQFMAAGPQGQRARVAQVISEGGIFIGGGFYELPSVAGPHSAEEVHGVEMMEISWRPEISREGPR